ncbi:MULTISPECIES: NUDIX domain-containing protein [Paenarthrobacter]|uniref:NUDIX domain-containing protein n=1 Tax=Paenarthrobacter ureafaciens TaxID=37931 RepID=A0AAX3ED57_PAEUR|nr:MULTISPECIES: NUDIX domain-containing protein [Paenarthrobacter]NKR12341.1 hypothetical protein [Arthrobacter sp. M5]NKR15665.1 hypothetical protein [Arthrobacter sp. M6]OEH62254.1 hypothetical protein A5N13_00845 [Arthrobacter sp. D4]OEH62825.1 hypothetical protein A5N17_09085 [Arthrobacter sp. D2]MDO5864977.1 NUDIX domain-containing protein [Paenarthrobacter sp. SD-2]
MKDRGWDGEAKDTGRTALVTQSDPGAANVQGRTTSATMTDCAACVARPSSLPQRVASIQAAIAAEREPLVALTHLLQLCRDEHPILQERIQDAGCRAKADLITAGVRALMPATSTESELRPQVAAALAAALTADEGLPAVVVARLLAELLDEQYCHSFRESFRRRSPYQPGVGDPVPLDSPDLRHVTALTATAPPWRLANRLDETRHVRLAGEWATQFQVIFDYSLARELTGIIDRNTVVATCHPNRTLADFHFPADASGRTFPVGPKDEDKQHQEIDRLIDAAVANGASIVVLPELCVTESLAARLQSWTSRTGGPRMLVAGSYHHDDEHLGTPRRRNTAIAYLRGVPAPLTQDKHSPADRPVNEDIQPQGWPQLRVHVSDDGWHLVLAICRDLLNPHAVHALAESGANLLLVPAMSDTLVAFGGPVANLVGSGQAFVAVANNPADFSGPADLTVHRPARALFGHPGFGQLVRLMQPANSAPGVGLLRVQTGQLQWLDSDSDSDSDRTMPSHGPSVRPPWADTLARLTGHDRPEPDRQPNPVTLNQAAVLVLLTDSPHGPSVLLTERASDLTNYPGQLVFPGGAADDGDHGPAATALREAREETALDPASVHILGTLPAIALFESGFLLTPVIAWSAGPVFTGTVNIAEVSRITTIPLYQRKGTGQQSQDPTQDEEPAAERESSTFGAGTSAILDMLRGMLWGPMSAGTTGH